MSSRSYESRTRKIPYARKINLTNNKKPKKRPPKLCPDCVETTNCINLLSNKVNKIEEILNGYYKNFPKRKTENLSAFNVKFTLNNIPCELEYDLSNFTLENLQKLVIFTTQHCTNNKNNDEWQK